MLPHLHQLLAKFYGLDHMHLHLRNKWGWGKTRAYSAWLDFATLQEQQHQIHTTKLWQHVWDPFGLPKINFFCWILMHKRTLTGDNLEKRGTIGPHKRPLYCKAQETIKHLFIDCPFSQEVWLQEMMGLHAQIPEQTSIVSLFATWKEHYPHNLKSKSTWTKIWNAIPKYICWGIWLARNEAISNKILQSTNSVTAKAEDLLLETFENRPHKPDNSLLPEELNWLGESLRHANIKKNISLPSHNQEWWLRIFEVDSKKWWKNQGKVTIFFNGATKGNPRISGVRGTIYSTDGHKKDSFSWGLGHSTNNQAKILGLLKACQLAQRNRGENLQIFGDTEILIKILNTGDLFNSSALNKTLERIRKIIQNYTSYSFSHVLRTLNKEVDIISNKGCLLAQGMLAKNDEEVERHQIT